MSAVSPSELEAVRQQWLGEWPSALALWSRFVQLHEPTWCLQREDERREQLASSFAMIRLVDHSIVVSLPRVWELGMVRFGREILAHEIGHHVYCPADLTDNARLLARIRYGLPGKEGFSPIVANLYSDLLINDRLQRTAGLDMAGVYLQLGEGGPSRLWTLYMRIYEMLWKLPKGHLAKADCDARLDQDGQLGARLIRSYARDWLDGAGRFAVLCLPYILQDAQRGACRLLAAWSDTLQAGVGGFPAGLVEIEEGEREGALHPAEDPELSGIEDLPEVDGVSGGRLPGELSGHKSEKTPRQPFEYAELLQASGVELGMREIAARYYRELAAPYLVPFPVTTSPQVTEPLPEALDVWDIDAPIEQLDWPGSFLAGPVVIPGVTTRERRYVESPGDHPRTLPFDLYVGIDCSGSMPDPAHFLSYPVLAGTIVALSALRAGARVKVVLSGEPGETLSTDGFLRDAPTVLRTLVSYLGSGYAFGIHRLAETFAGERTGARPVHILIVSDQDMFRMLDQQGNGRRGWSVAREALECCGGGGSYVLHLHPRMLSGPRGDRVERYLGGMREDGWQVSLVDSMEQLVTFARRFSRAHFDRSSR